ncbi:MAG TPA: hypothetical protein VNO34_09495 [Actinomycetota bacterium]|nr:hypothetical protein [Actinomycetota bacterium]
MSDERGVGAVEVAVVVLLVGILSVITVPTLVGARRQAQDRRAKATLAEALAAAGRHRQANGRTFLGFDEAAAEALAPALEWRGGRPSAPVPGVLYITQADRDLHLVTESASGRFFGVHVSGEDGTAGYCSGRSVAAVDEAAECRPPHL